MKKTKKKKAAEKKEKKEDKKDKKDKKDEGEDISGFTKGRRVSWFKDGKLNYGYLNKDAEKSKKNISVKLENGKFKTIPIKLLEIVVSEEPEPEQAEEEEKAEQSEGEEEQTEEEDEAEQPQGNIIVPQSIKDIKEGLKIKAKYKGNIFSGYIGKIDKRMKKNVNVILQEGEGQMNVKIPLKDIIEIIL